jgi:predicted dithiol-disulfide oxidoreductase (DUF899 family)
MPEHETGTREEWQAARDELAKLEAEQAELGRKVTEQRRRLPWVPVEGEYEFNTGDGKTTLAELFDGRSQLLAYNKRTPKPQANEFRAWRKDEYPDSARSTSEPALGSSRSGLRR